MQRFQTISNEAMFKPKFESKRYCPSCPGPTKDVIFSKLTSGDGPCVIKETSGTRGSPCSSDTKPVYSPPCKIKLITSVSLYIHSSIWMYVCLSVHLSVYVCICMYDVCPSVRLCTYACMQCIHAYVSMYVCVCMFIDVNSVTDCSECFIWRQNMSQRNRQAFSNVIASFD